MLILMQQINEHRDFYDVYPFKIVAYCACPGTYYLRLRH